MTRDDTSLETPATWAELNRCTRELSHFKTALVGMLRQGKLSKEAHDQRVQAIGQLTARLEQLSALSRERRKIHKEIHDLGLPDTTLLGKRELGLVDQMLNQRLGTLKESYNQIKKFTAWVEEACRGESSGWRGTMRLGKFKKIVAEHEQQEALVDKETKGQAGFIKKVSTKLKSLGARQEEDNLETLMQIFTHINNLSGRLSRLDEKIRKEKGLISQMNSWLAAQHESDARESRLNPPSLAEFREAEAFSKSDRLDPLEYSRKRLTIAQKFVSQCQEATDTPNMTPVRSFQSQLDKEDGLAN